MLRDRWDGDTTKTMERRELAFLQIGSEQDFTQYQANLIQALLKKHPDFENKSQVIADFYGDMGEQLRAHAKAPEQFQVLPLGFDWFDIGVIVLVLYLLLSKSKRR